MPNRSEIEAAVKAATGNPDTGVVAEITPTIVNAINELCNPEPETNTKTKPHQETRIMGKAETPETSA